MMGGGEEGEEKFNIKRQLVSFLMVFSENKYILKRGKTIYFLRLYHWLSTQKKYVFPI